MTNKACKNDDADCPGPGAYKVDQDAGLCLECEYEALMGEEPTPVELDKHGNVLCFEHGCGRAAVAGALCTRHMT